MDDFINLPLGRSDKKVAPTEPTQQPINQTVEPMDVTATMTPKMMLDQFKPSGFTTGFEQAALSSGEGIEEASFMRISKNYEDYADNQKSYDAYAKLEDGVTSYNTKARIEKAIDRGLFTLDDELNVVGAHGYFSGAELFYDNDAVRGYLLMQKNGYSKQNFFDTYAEVTKEKSEALARDREGTDAISNFLGAIGYYMTEPETAIEFMSPGKIVASSLPKAAVKAFGVETMFATVAETIREDAVREHMQNAGLDYSIWDSIQSIATNAGMAGAFRAGGSAISDAAVLSKINNKLKDSTDKEIFARFMQIEQYKLTKDGRKHIELMERAREDIDNGKQVDIEAHTDIDIETKTSPEVEPVSLNDEVRKVKPDDSESVAQFEKELDETPPYKDTTPDEDLYGVASQKEAEDLIEEMALDNPELKAEFEQVKLSRQAQQAKEAKDVPVGGSEDEAKQAVKDVFSKANTTDDIYKGMSQDEIKQIDEYMKQDAELMAEQKAIEDEINAFASESAGVGGTSVFAQFGPELFAGSINGIEYNTDTGEFKFDPMRFMAAFLGGHIAKKIATNPKVQAVAKKEALAYAQRLHDRLKDKPMFKYVTGTNYAVDDTPGVAKADKDLIVQHNLTEENIKHAEGIGGLAVPSLAVTKADTPLTGFGEITLLGKSDLVNPSKDIKVYGADVYSPRYPQIKYSLTARQQKTIDEDLARYEEVTGSREYAEKDSLNALYDNTAFRAKFLDEKGVKVKLAKTEKANKESMDIYKKYYKNIVPFKNFVDSQQLRVNPEFQKAYIQELKDTDPAMLLQMELGDPLGLEASDALKNLSYRRAQKLSSLKEQNDKAGRPDEYAIKSTIRDIINKKKLGGELKQYASKYLKDIGAKETIYNGTDSYGRAKYIEHTISNVVDKLKKNIRGGESFNYGVGTTRAKLTPEFKTLAAIKKNKDKLVTSDEFEKIKDEMADRVQSIAEDLRPYYEYDSDSFGYQEEVLHAIGDQDLRGYGFKNIPDDVKEDVSELITALKEMPTEYFEAKVLKVLDIGEFKVAVVPNGTSKETIQILKDKGVKVSKYNPSDENARKEAIKKTAEREKVLFMHPVTVGGAIITGYIASQQDEGL